MALRVWASPTTTQPVFTGMAVERFSSASWCRFMPWVFKVKSTEVLQRGLFLFSLLLPCTPTAVHCQPVAAVCLSWFQDSPPKPFATPFMLSNLWCGSSLSMAEDYVDSAHMDIIKFALRFIATRVTLFDTFLSHCHCCINKCLLSCHLTLSLSL